jgi:serine/threonine-protein kinase HipA
MARPPRNPILYVWMNGEYVGQWICPLNKAQEFIYAKAWAASPTARSISLSMPVGSDGATYEGAVVERFFENLLPDNREIRQRIRQHVGAQSEKAFDLLAMIGRDCIGALQLTTDQTPAPDVRKINGTTIGESEIAQILRNTVSAPALGRPEENDDFRFSLAGAQEKTALLRVDRQWMRPHGATPSTHILKLPIGKANQGIDLHTSVENEWLCAEILRAFGIATAHCWMDQFGEQKVLVVERFDRRLSTDRSWIVRLPQEDMCQATGTDRDEKYEADGGPGIEKIMGILLGSTDAELDRFEFFRTQIVFWMLCAIDGHAKNFSLFLEAGGGYRLTPRYDVMSAFPVLGKKAGQLSPFKVKMAMAMQSGKNRHYHWNSILRRHIEGMAHRCGLASRLPGLIDGLVEQTPRVIANVESILPKDFPLAVSEPILQGLASSAEKLAMSTSLTAS